MRYPTAYIAVKDEIRIDSQDAYENMAINRELGFQYRSCAASF